MRKLLLAMSLMAMTSLAQASQNQFDIDAKWQCGETNIIKETLSQRGEEFIGSGAVQNTAQARFLMSIWVNPKTRHWTILATVLEKNEISCVVSFGTLFSPQMSKPTI
jgi:hypothetical protein